MINPLTSAARAWHQARSVSIEAGVPVVTQLRQLARLRRTTGIARAEYFKYRLWRPALDHPIRLTYTSQRERRRTEVAINPRRAGAPRQSKTRAQERFGRGGLPIPVLLGLVATGTADHGIVASRSPEALAVLLGDVGSSPVVIKPDRGKQGEGVLVIPEADARGVCLLDGTELTVPALWRLLVAHAGDGVWRVERWVRPHSLLAAYRPGATPTVRLLTLRVDGGVTVHAATLKIPRGDSGADNLARGNLVASIDLASGLVGPATDGTGVRRFDAHPDSHRPIAGLRVPHWREVTEVGRVGAAQEADCRALGWDIAVTADGPVILEANRSWDEKLLQLPAECGVTHGAMIRLLDEVGAGHLLASRRRIPSWRAFEAGERDRPFQGGGSPA